MQWFIEQHSYWNYSCQLFWPSSASEIVSILQPFFSPFRINCIVTEMVMFGDKLNFFYSVERSFHLLSFVLLEMKWFCLYCMSFPLLVTWEQFTKWFCSIHYLAKLDFQWNWDTDCVSQTKKSINYRVCPSPAFFICVSMCIFMCMCNRNHFILVLLKRCWRFIESLNILCSIFSRF